MSKTLKWILGILAVLVVLAIVAGAVWFWQNRGQLLASNRPYAAQPGAPRQQPFLDGPRTFGYRGRNPMGQWGFVSPMMRVARPGLGVFGIGLFFLGGLFRLIIPLAVLAVVAIIFYQLGRRSARPVSSNTPPPLAETPKSD